MEWESKIGLLLYRPRLLKFASWFPA